MLLIVGHHPFDLQTAMARPQDRDRCFAGSEIAAALDPGQWHIVTDAPPERTATDPGGHVVTIHDTVVRARRHGSGTFA